MIAGIDPGTTVGWAVITLTGELVAANSQKELNRDKLISELVKTGRVLVVGSDKAKIPSFVREVAVKIGARIINPAQDMLVEEKRELTRNYNFTSTHQMDALASAILAHRKLQPLILKIKSFLAKENKQNLFFSTAELVIKEGISIKAALAILEPPKKEITAEVQEEKRDDDAVKLFSTIQKLRKDNEILRKHNQMLEQRAKQAEENLQKLASKNAQLVKPQKPAEAVKQKQNQLFSMSQRLEHNKRQEQEIKKKIDLLENCWLEGYTPILRLKTLSWKEVKEKEKYVHRDSILFIDNVNAMSTQALDWLEKKEIAFVITGSQVGKNARQALPFHCFNIKEYRAFESLVGVKQNVIDKLRSEKELLARILKEYKINRKSI